MIIRNISFKDYMKGAQGGNGGVTKNKENGTKEPGPPPPSLAREPIIANDANDKAMAGTTNKFTKSKLTKEVNTLRSDPESLPVSKTPVKSTAPPEKIQKVHVTSELDKMPQKFKIQEKKPLSESVDSAKKAHKENYRERLAELKGTTSLKFQNLESLVIDKKSKLNRNSPGIPLGHLVLKGRRERHKSAGRNSAGDHPDRRGVSS
jgi:hypothetical protein